MCLLYAWNSRKLVTIYPEQLQFPFVLNRQTSSPIQIRNNTDNYVAFKVYVTDPKKYCVRPNRGILSPDSTIDILVTMQAQTQAPADKICKDKFKINSVITSPESTIKDITSDMFKKASGNVVDEFNMNVLLVSPPQQPLPVTNKLFNSEKLVTVYPQQLQFPLVLNEQTSCPIQIRNNTNNNVAFKVLTTHPKKYCVRPNLGIMLPDSTCDVLVIMQAHKEAPADKICKDKFKIASVITSPESSIEDITSDMFKKASGNVVDEFKMKVLLVSTLQQPVPLTGKWFNSGIFSCLFKNTSMTKKNN